MFKPCTNCADVWADAWTDYVMMQFIHKEDKTIGWIKNYVILFVPQILINATV